MRLLLLVILLGFPVADLYATLRFAQWTGVPVWVWLSISVVSGLLLLRNERMAFRGHVLAALHGEQPLLRGVVDSGRKVLAGLFFLLPGVVSDLIARRAADAADQYRPRLRAATGRRRTRRPMAGVSRWKASTGGSSSRGQSGSDPS